MGQVNVIPQVYKGNYVKAALDSNGNVDYLESAAGIVGYQTPASFPLSKLNPALMSVGSKVRVPKIEFINNAGIPDSGISLMSDGVNLVTSNPGQIFSRQDGTSAAPLVAAWSAGAAAKTIMPIPGGPVIIPWQLMRKGLRLKLSATFRFVSAVVPASSGAKLGLTFGKSNSAVDPYACWLDTTFSAGKNNETVSEVYVNSGTGFSAQQIIKNHGIATTATQYVADFGSSLDWSGFGNSYINVAVAPYTGEAAATYDLINYEVVLL